MALIENIQREDLNPIEEAHAYRRLAEEYQLTQEQIADAVGKDRSSVANYVRLLGCPRKCEPKWDPVRSRWAMRARCSRSPTSLRSAGREEVAAKNLRCAKPKRWSRRPRSPGTEQKERRRKRCPHAGRGRAVAIRARHARADRTEAAGGTDRD